MLVKNRPACCPEQASPALLPGSVLSGQELIGHSDGLLLEPHLLLGGELILPVRETLVLDKIDLPDPRYVVEQDVLGHLVYISHRAETGELPEVAD